MYRQVHYAACMEQRRFLYSKKEAARLLSLSLRSIDNLITSKKLVVRRVGRRVLVPEEAIAQFARQEVELRRP
jgi:excisionase family DNA binding protein